MLVNGLFHIMNNFDGNVYFGKHFETGKFLFKRLMDARCIAIDARQKIKQNTIYIINMFKTHIKK